MKVPIHVLGTLPPNPGDAASIPIDVAPDHAMALGRLLGHWAFLEQQLTSVLSVLLRLEDQKYAKFIWQEFVSASGKIELIQRTNFHLNKDEKLRDELDKLLKNAKTLNGIRNGYIHAVWTHTTEGFNGVLQRHKNTAPNDYRKDEDAPIDTTAEDIQSDVTKIATLSLAFSHWWSRFATKNPTLRKP